MAALGLASSLLPYVLGARRPEVGTPRQLAFLASITLLGVAGSFIGMLAALVVPQALPVVDLPRTVELCAAAAGRLFAHPLRHWPSIFAAVLLLLVLARLGTGLVLTLRDVRRARPPRHPLPGEPAFPLPPEPSGARLVVVPTKEVVAYTTGLLRARIIVSTGFLEQIDEESRRAVLAHEQAHAKGRHVPLLFMARTIGRAFWFVPPVRLAAWHLVTALECSADETAARAVGDRLVVARALVRMASVSPSLGPQGTLRMGNEEIAFRARRLAAAGPSNHRRSPVIVVATVLGLATMLMAAEAWSTGRTAIARETQVVALHETCHLPHSTPDV